MLEMRFHLRYEAHESGDILAAIFFGDLSLKVSYFLKVKTFVVGILPFVEPPRQPFTKFASAFYQNKPISPVSLSSTADFITY